MSCWFGCSGLARGRNAGQNFRRTTNKEFLGFTHDALYHLASGLDRIDQPCILPDEQRAVADVTRLARAGDSLLELGSAEAHFPLTAEPFLDERGAQHTGECARGPANAPGQT